MAFGDSINGLFYRRKAPPIPPASSRPGQPQPPIYRPLNSDTRHIRLATIDPGGDADPPVCRLASHALSKGLKYRCLSYVWGDAHDKQTIFLNGQAFEVTSNLYSALCQLRHNGERKHLWIDAICINQADPAEKTAQVQMMADIYSGTEEVLIWLGEEPKLSGPMLVRDLPGANMLAYDVRSEGKSTIKQVQENDSIAFKHAMTDGSKPDFASIASLFSHLASGGHLCKLKHFTKWSTGDGLMRPAWDWFMVTKALKDFSRLPWYSRTWTVQEVILAPKATIMYGSHRSPWQDIIQAATNLGKYASPNAKAKCGCATIFATMPHEHRDILRQWAWRVHDIQTIKVLHLAQTHNTWDLLVQCRSRQASDPRDKVFALLGLGKARRGEAGLVDIDYSLTVRQVYSAVAIAQIRLSHKLGALETEVAHALPDLPTWVTDWTAISKVDINLSQIRATLPGLYHAGPALGIKTLAYDEKDCTLTLPGRPLDIIAELSEPFPINDSECETFIPVYEQWKHFISQLGAPSSIYAAGDTIEQALHQTLVADSVTDEATDQTRRATAAEAHAFGEWLKGVAKAMKSGSVVQNHDLKVSREDMHVKAVLAHRRLMITASGYMGLAPAGAAAGDSVYVFNGARMPSVLRFAGRQPQDLVFKLVGPCFIQGIMDGEVEGIGRPLENITLV